MIEFLTALMISATDEHEEFLGADTYVYCDDALNPDKIDVEEFIFDEVVIYE